MSSLLEQSEKWIFRNLDIFVFKFFDTEKIRKYENLKTRFGSVILMQNSWAHFRADFIQAIENCAFTM